MTLTVADLQEILHHTHERAKQRRADDGFKDESFMPGAIILGGDGKMTMIACRFANNDEKMQAMDFLWERAKEQAAIAVFFYSDARLIQSEAYCKHYDITMDEFEEHRQRTLRAVGGSFGNLPHEVWEDSIITWCMGPDFPVKVLSTAYTGGPDDTVVFTPTEDHKDNKTKQYMMPKWW